MRYWYSGPWQLLPDEFFGSVWDRPAGAIGMIDFRSNLQSGSLTGTPGAGLFVTEEPLTDSAYTLLGAGDWSEIHRSQRLVDHIPKRKGFVPAGDNLAEVVLSLLTDGADPRGEEFARPTIPFGNGCCRLRIAGLSIERQIDSDSAYWNRVQDVLRSDFAEYFQQSQAGLMQDPEQPRRVLDGWCEQYKQPDWRQFVPATLQPHIAGRLPHATAYAENFNGYSNQTGLPGFSPCQGNGHDVFNFQARGTNATQGSTRSRFDSDLSSSNMSCEVQVVSFSSLAGVGVGPSVRNAAAADTMYTVQFRTSTSPRRRVFRLQAGTANVIASDDTAPPGTPFYLKISVTAGDIRVYVDGVEVTALAISDGVLTGGLRGGHCGGQSATTANRSIIDDFSVGDLITGALLPRILAEGLFVGASL